VGKGEGKAKEASAHGSAGRLPRRWFFWLVLVAGANFFLGVLVGRGTSPLRFDIQALQKEIAALRETEARSEMERFHQLMSGSGEDQPLDFYDVLKKDDRPRPAPVPKKKIAPVSAASAEQTAKRAPDAPSAKKASGPSVQVAAMREAAAAQRIVERLVSQGFAARSVRIRTADRGTWYRVRIGPFADRQAAKKVRDRLSRLNYDAIVVDP